MTPNDLTTSRQCTLLGELARLVSERAAAETDVEAVFARRTSEIQTEYGARVEQVTETMSQQHAALESEYLDHISAARVSYEDRLARVREAAKHDIERLGKDYVRECRSAQQKWKAALAKSARMFQSEREEILREFRRVTRECMDRRLDVSSLEAQARHCLRRFSRSFDFDQLVAALPSDPDMLPREAYSAATKRTATTLATIRNWKSVQFLDQGWPLFLFVFGSLAAVYPAGTVFGWRNGLWLMVAVGLALIVSLASRHVAYVVARRKLGRIVDELFQAFSQARLALRYARQMAKNEARGRLATIGNERTRRIDRAGSEWQQSFLKSRIRRDAGRKGVAKAAAEQRRQIENSWEQEAQTCRQHYLPRLKSSQHELEATRTRLEREHEAEQTRIRQEYDDRWESIETRWKTGFENFDESIAAMNQFCMQRFPDYERIECPESSDDTESLPALRFGQYTVDLQTFAGGLPTNARLVASPTAFQVPALLSFPENPSLLLKCHGRGRDEAVHAIRNIMLRFLTSLPPGKVRFTIVDPIGLGQNFSAFMHLADYDERLVTSRIWTESSHIDRRLADLTEHMEDVIQMYLRNEFQSIQEYNAVAGEIAEPFHILVVANFPANFSEEASRRLLSIASSGARCGVFTLLSADAKMNLPRNFRFEDLEQYANTLQWRDDHFGWQGELERYPLALDMPPHDELFNSLLHMVGQEAKESNRVEVPFRVITPERSTWWQGDSRSEIGVPLGRAGASKLQNLQLGRGTSQHVLIAGKTGSGKSTFLHALITNLAMHYSPDEVCFFLIDFKKGVEFKAYADQQLPHARVIAIESEREFGMSVLERLDGELRRRGDLFRGVGAQDLAGFRRSEPDHVMPRLLLIIDEFQEFFVKEDKIAHEASLLLDRLVRQGRAFGIHVLLGSQTLGGSYSLARSTIGQMAVRIALQCSESDAHLILSEENTAARLLNRPGEAIYNDANGLFEGNHPFQVAWLPDQERDSYLQQITELARQRNRNDEPPIVFEGNATADPGENRNLRKALEAPPSRETPLAPRAWLGASLAIKEPAAVDFRRQSGHNLLIVGHGEESVTGMLVNCLVSLAAFSPVGAKRRDVEETRFRILDGSQSSSSKRGFWNDFAQHVPLDIDVIPPKGAGDVLSQIAAEVVSRQEAENDTAPAIFLLLYDLARLRCLKRSDKDFGFSSFDDEESASPSQQLASILSDGPALGIHTLIWCDTNHNLNRYLERQALHDLELRVLLQMNATDSTHLMDSAEAGQLGMYRAILFREDLGESEKFRPYGRPTSDWLAWVSERLRARMTGISPRDSSRTK